MTTLAKQADNDTQTRAISVEHLPSIMHKNVPVITTDLLAELYGTNTVRIRQNHKRNVERFICGKHFFKLEGAELHGLKNRVSSSYSVGKQAKSLILWTERGAARHAKMLETDQAWEVFEKLEDYYFNAKASATTTEQRKTTTDQRTPLRDAVNLLVSKRHLMYPEAYAMIHQRFNVSSIEDLSSEQIPMAVEYVHRVILDGEYLGKQEALPTTVKQVQFTNDELCALSWLWLVADKMRRHAEETYPALKQLESKYAGDACDIAREFKYWLGNTESILSRETRHIAKPSGREGCYSSLAYLRENHWNPLPR